MGGKCWHCPVQGGARDAQGVRAPGWEFCFPLLSFDSRPVEVGDQQNKCSCSSSQLFGLFPSWFYLLGGFPCPLCWSRDRMCRGISLRVVG